MDIQQAKTLFCAQYLGQLWQTYDHQQNIIAEGKVFWLLSPHEITQSVVLLRTVDMLTDEECIKLCRMVCRDQYTDVVLSLHDNTFQAKPIQWRETIKAGLSFIGISFITKRENQHTAINNHILHITNWGAITKFIRGDVSVDFPVMQVFQYLLRIGILLPFTYLNDLHQPETLTPAQLIEMGWAKIK